MGLITKEVEITLTSNTVNYYKNLGYDVGVRENYGKLSSVQNLKIIVKVKDLPEGSHQIVIVKCDECGKIYSMEYRNYIKWKRGEKIYCKKCSKKLFYSGKNSPNYNLNKTQEERELERNYLEYKEFVKRVLARDNYTCQCCGQYKGDLEVHHLDGYSWCIEKRTDDTNGVTLCVSCHNNFHSLYSKKKNTKEQYMEWLGVAKLELITYNGTLPKARYIYCIEEEKIYEGAVAFATAKSVSVSYVYHACNKQMRSKKIKEHFMWYNEYLQSSEKEVKEYIAWHDEPIVYSPKTPHEAPNSKKVVCLNTRELFLSIRKGAFEKGLTSTKGISDCCNHKALTAGVDKNTGEPCVWRFLDEYEKMSESEIATALEIVRISTGKTGRTGKYSPNSKKTICLTTAKIFDSATEAKKYYNASKISECCNGKRKFSGKLPDGTPLQWMYYEDFLKLPIEEQNEILARNQESSTDDSFIM